MSILIKGMEMPKNCMECPLYNGVGCKATNRMFAMFYNVAIRRDDCPLIELPPHGRLIDADALINAVPKAEADIFENCRYCTCLDSEQIKDLINDAPTIIEAEVEDGSN